MESDHLRNMKTGTGKTTEAVQSFGKLVGGKVKTAMEAFGNFIAGKIKFLQGYFEGLSFEEGIAHIVGKAKERYVYHMWWIENGSF